MAIIGIATLASVGVLISPLLIGIAGRLNGVDWQELSDIGQAYGAASAILSALAVLGVAASLTLQGRALRAASVHSVRNAHRELLGRVMDDPNTYLPATGFQRWRNAGMRPEQWSFLTSYFGYAYAALDCGVVSEEDMRADIFTPMFAGEVGRKWWSLARLSWLESSDPLARRVGRVAESAYQLAVDSGEPLPLSFFTYQEPERPYCSSPQEKDKTARIMISAAALAGATAVAIWGAKRKPRKRP
ncbi:DUF6082 family protein [Actinoplanes sp. NPDC020271]|uniref:DUF6082 family protein n=1 Tax=Actinoplanes sp. NPDC020271 TaxID=3363896 RepID=UPI0037A3F3D0